jgi:DNA-binding NtrC family response regulator
MIGITGNLKEYLLGVERQCVEVALEKANGNKTYAAELLGVNRTTLIEKCRRLGLLNVQKEQRAMTEGNVNG